jgi:hypothetical protein
MDSRHPRPPYSSEVDGVRKDREILPRGDVTVVQKKAAGLPLAAF